MVLPHKLDSVIAPIKVLMRALVEDDTPTLESMIPNWETLSVGVKDEINNYGCKLIIPPEFAYSAIEYVEVGEPQEQLFFPPEWEFEYGMLHITKMENGTWDVLCSMWTEEEGISDLAMQLSIDQGENSMTILALNGFYVP